MAIVKVQRKTKDSVYRVRWKDEAGKWHSRTFDRKRDAEAWEAKVVLAKRRGDLDDLDAGQQRLEDFVEEWWQLEAEPRLAPKTRELYRYLLDTHILSGLGSYQLRHLRPAIIQRYQAERLAAGAGEVILNKAMTLLGSILERAVEWGKLQQNPARSVRKPPAHRRTDIRPLSPAEVERIRQVFLRRGGVRDATLVSVLAYGGLRPGEALALAWADIREGGIRVNKRVSLGVVREGGKSSARSRRTVEVLAPLRGDIREYWLASGRPGDDILLFPTRAGTHWHQHDWRNWVRRHFHPAVESAGLEKLRVYDLRHSFASLLLAERRNPLEVAEQLGHSPKMTLDTYGHVIDDLRGRSTVEAETEIRRARS